MYFLKKAKKVRKPILELESMELQIGMFVNFDKYLQERMLLDALGDGKGFQDKLGQIFDAWKTGNAKRMYKIAIADSLKAQPDLKSLYAKMFDERNVKMAKKIEGYLKGNDVVFVLVGSGHIPGKMGILKLLRDKGYKVRQLSRNPVSTEK